MTTPRATYRLQLNQDFTLVDAERLIPYLKRLGIDTLYLSPIFQARKGSPHGYDVTDPNAVNPELGGNPALEHLFESLKAHHMGVILDVVPNHMAADRDNRWWWDLLVHGEASPVASFFDIDWEAPGANHQLVLPCLAHSFGEVLEAGALRIELENSSGFVLTYYDRQFPLTPRSWRPILAQVLHSLFRSGQKRARYQLYDLWRQLAHPDTLDRSTHADTLYRWRCQHPRAIRDVRQVLSRWNGVQGQPQSWSRVEQLLRGQPWRLVHFTLASSEGNYRRFFDINDLPAVSIERETVFEHVQALLLELAKRPVVYGLRIDHIDGLYDPQSYLLKLFSCLERAASNDYLIVEKILGPGESLPLSWPVAGTTGYDFLNAAMTVLLDPEGLTSLTSLYSRWHDSKPPGAAIDWGKQQVLTDLFQSELDRLVRQLLPIAREDRWGHDLTILEIKGAIGALTLSLPIYRTYLNHGPVSSWDRNILHDAIQRAREQYGHLPTAAWILLERVLLHAEDPTLTQKQRKVFRDWTMRWQQLTGPIHAKGFEDTALYRYHRLTCLNEVGSDLYSEGLHPKTFHAMIRDRQATHPFTLNTTSTHDTKRSEDVRARLGILSEIPALWQTTVTDWHDRAQSFFEVVDNVRVPDPATEYLLFQSLVGAYPLHQTEVPSFVTRLHLYIEKAVREAKIYSDWVHPHLGYEQALHRFVDHLFTHKDMQDALHPFVQTVSYYGALSSLSQILLKTLAPGVPDFYQGSELWDLSLTDPDNRRPVDFSRRQQLLEQMTTNPPSLEDLLTHWDDGRLKLYVTHEALKLRHHNARLFEHGTYQGLAAQGSQTDHVLTFARHHEDQWCIVVVPRHYARLTWSYHPKTRPSSHDIWQTTTLNVPAGAPHHWREILSGQPLQAEMGQIPLAEIFSRLPIAILRSQPG